MGREFSARMESRTGRTNFQSVLQSVRTVHKSLATGRHQNEPLIAPPVPMAEKPLNGMG